MEAQLGATARRKGFGFSRLEGVGGMPCAMLALQRRTLIRDSSLKPRRTGGIMLVNSHYDIITRPIFENWLHYSTCILSPTKPEESASFARRGELKGGFWCLAFNMQTIFAPKLTWFLLFYQLCSVMWIHIRYLICIAHTLQIMGLFRPQLILWCNYPIENRRANFGWIKRDSNFIPWR